VILFDVDHFKQINDAHGHAIGDQVLVAVARTVQQNLRGIDVAVRWGGEELLVLLPQTDTPGARFVADRTRLAVAANAEPGVPQVTISAGVTTWQPDEAITATVARADERLYEAKNTGRNRVC